MGGAIKVLTFDEVVALHYKAITIDQNSLYTQSNFNLLHRGSLEVVLNQIQYPMFGQERFPTLIEKVSVLCWRIIKGHIFRDGNKRTGLLCLMTMLELNGYQLTCGSKETLDMALAISSAQAPLEEFTSWVEQRIAPLEPSSVEPSTAESLADFITKSNPIS